MKRLQIFDTTLRDGEQSPGYGMTSDQKLQLAKQLEALGVDVIEAGFPAASPEDLAGVQNIARAVKKSTIATLARCADTDIEACARGLEHAASGRIHIFLSTSDLHLEHKLGIDRQTALEKIVKATRLARKYSNDVEFSPEDATRTEIDYLILTVQAAVDEGANVINLPDTVGYSSPGEYRAMFETVRARVRGIDKVTLSAHCHNDLGLAVANSLAAIEGGATQVECTINGIGERAGNASLEEIIMALHVRGNVYPYETRIDTKLIYPTSQLLSALTGVGVQPNKAVVGRNAFAHESGVHQHGVIKDRRTYEIMTPESVGAPPTRLVLGRHSGRHAVAARLADLGYPVAGTTLNHVYDRFLRACESGTALGDDDLIQIALDNRPPPNPPYVIALVQASAGTVRPATATVRLTREGQTYVACALGDGPVDAVCTCIDNITGHPARVVGYELRAISEGRDAEGEVSLRVLIDERTFSGRAVGSDIVEASARAYLSAVTKCLATRREIKPPQVPAVVLPPRELFAERNHDSAKTLRVVSLPGDGIGPEVCGEAVRVLELGVKRAGRKLEIIEMDMGGVAIDRHGEPLPQKTREACVGADAVLLGAVGGPKWDVLSPDKRPEKGLLGLREALGVFANLRPVKAREALLETSPLRPEIIRGTDLVVVRELLGDLYFGKPRGIEGKPRRGFNTMVYTEDEVRRIAIVGFDLARTRKKLVTSVDKANVLETSRLWRDVVTEVKADYPDVELRHALVDSCAMDLIRRPTSFDVVLTSNMFGDILSDEASVLAGSIGLLPSASIGSGPGFYEPIHGSAPDIAGKGIANPLGAIASAAEMLRRSLGMPELADKIDRAIDQVLDEGKRTADLGGKVSTSQMGGFVCQALERLF